MNLTDLALDRPVTTVMGLLCVLVLGALAVFALPLEYLPTFSSNSLWIRVGYPSSSPQEVERLITLPLEESLGGLPGLERMRSTSGSDQSAVQLEFSPDVDMDIASMEVRERLDRARGKLPGDVRRIWVRRFQASDIPVLNVAVSTDRDADTLFRYVEEELVPALERQPGVASADVRGVREKELRIEADPGKLRALGLTPRDLQQTLMRSHLSQSAGPIEEAGRRMLVRVDGELDSASEFAALPVDGTALVLGDLATARYEYPPVRDIRRLDGNEAVSIRIYKNTSANLVEVANAATSAVGRLEADAERRGIRFFVYRDRSSDVRDGLKSLASAGLVGGLLAVVFIFIFLRDLPSTLLIGATVPMSMVSAAGLLLILRRMGSDVTLNIVSLMGAVLAVGMVVDNAVVVLENIYRHRVLGKSRMQAARDGAGEVRTAITAATLTSICVFLPTVVVNAGRGGVWMKAFGITICVALAASLLLSLSLIPLAAGRFSLGQTKEEPRLSRALSSIYGRWIRFSLRHRPLTIVVTISLLGGSVWLFGQIEREFMPSTPARRLTVVGELPASMRFPQALELATTLESRLMGEAEKLDLRHLDSDIERGSIRFELYLAEEDEATVQTSDAKKHLESLLPEIPGVTWKLERLRRWEGSDLGVSVELNGPSFAVLELLAEEIKDRLGGIEGIEDIETSLEEGTEELRLQVDRRKAEQLGVSPTEVARAVSLGVSQRPVGTLVAQDREIPIQIGLFGGETLRLEELAQMILPGREGRPVPLGSVLSVARGRSGKDRVRVDRKGLVTVFASTSRRGMFTVSGAISAALSDLEFPPGYGYSLGDDFRNWQESESGMGAALLLALLLIYVIMASLFESFVHPFTILFSVPFAFIGVALTFYLTGTTLSSFGWLGLLVLSGIVVNNAIVFLDLAQQLRRDGMPASEAVPLAGELRLRPILLTALTTILGLMPMTAPLLLPEYFGPLEGRAEMWAPVGLAILGGLTTSTFLTLTVVPTLYTVFDDLAAMGLRIVRRLAGSGEP